MHAFKCNYILRLKCQIFAYKKYLELFVSKSNECKDTFPVIVYVFGHIG